MRDFQARAKLSLCRASLFTSYRCKTAAILGAPPHVQQHRVGMIMREHAWRLCASKMHLRPALTAFRANVRLDSCQIGKKMGDVGIVSRKPERSWRVLDGRDVPDASLGVTPMTCIH